MAVGDIITAARYNNLQSRVATVIGTGSGDSGYGQSLNSSQVATSEVVTATHMTLLFADLDAGRKHQTNVGTTEIALIAATDIIEDSNNINKKGVAEYENLTTTLETNRFLCEANQATVESPITGAYSVAWNGQLDHIVNVTFTDSNHARNFFNAGGEIRFAANITPVGSESKTIDWATMLANMEVIKFDYFHTHNGAGSGTGAAIGFHQLTTSYQQIFDKQGTGQYIENHYIIEAKGNVATPDVVTFRINFNDDDPTDPGTPTDEFVTGTLTSLITQFRATGVNVSVPTPTYANDGAGQLT